MASKKEQALNEENAGSEMMESAEAVIDAETVENASTEAPEAEPTDNGETEQPSGDIQDPDEDLLTSIVGDEAEEGAEAQESSDETGLAFTEDVPDESVETMEADDRGIQAEDVGEDAAPAGTSAEPESSSGTEESVEGDYAPDGDAGADGESTGTKDVASGDNTAKDGENAAVQRTSRPRGRPTRSRRPVAPSTQQVSNERRRRDVVQDRIRREDRQERRDERNDAWADMQGAMLYGRILSGKITGVRNLNDRVYAVVMFGGIYLVLIPFQSFYVNNPINMSAANAATTAGQIELRQRQTAMLEKHYGYETPFIITRMERGEGGAYVILGSRSAALNRRAHENFTPSENGEVVMRPGDIVPAVVTSVAEHSIAVNVGGVDTRIRVSDLTFRYVPSGEKILENYSVGQTIPVMILESQKTEKGHWTCRVSRRRVEMEEAKVRHHLFAAPGDLTSAIVTGKYFRQDNGRAYLRLYLDAYDIPAATNNVPKRPNGEYPAIGESYRVSFQEYNEETGVTYVNLRGYHGPARL